MKLATGLFILLLSFLNTLYAESVTAGTRIKNTATLHYTSNMVDYSIMSNEIEDRIAQLVDIKLEWLDDDPVMVTSGDQAKVLHFRLTNLGNADDQFSLLLIDQERSVFTVENLKLVKDIDGDGLYNPDIDQVIDTIGLKPGERVELLAVADIPQLDKSSIGYATQTLAVRSKAPTDTTSEIPVVKKKGYASIDGIYQSVDYALRTRKEAAVVNQLGGTIPVRGATITYTIYLSMEGIGEVTNIVINDTIPEGTVYVAGSLRLDSNSLSDGIDGDAGHYNGDDIAVKIPAMKQTKTVKPQHSVSFQVVII